MGLSARVGNGGNPDLELFGPFLALKPFEDPEKMVQELITSRYGFLLAYLGTPLWRRYRHSMIISGWCTPTRISFYTAQDSLRWQESERVDYRESPWPVA